MNERKRLRKRGTALIETALVLPLLVLLTFGMMEYGWMFLQMHQVTNAARAGVRQAVLPDATNLTVEDTVGVMMTAFHVAPGAYRLTTDPLDIAAVEPGAPVRVSLALPYANVELLGIPLFPTPTTLRVSAVMAKEGP